MFLQGFKGGSETLSRILFLVNHDLTIYNFRFELVKKLISCGNEVFISSPNGEKIKYLTDIGCNFTETPVSRHGTNPFTDFKLFLIYLKLIKKIKPDVILSYTIKPNIYGGIAAFLNRTAFMPNVTGLGIAVENPGLMQRFIKLLYKAAFKHAACVFFQNCENMLFFEKNRLYNGHRRILPGSGVNLGKFTPLKYPDTDEINFVFVSRIMKDKGIEEYLECAEYKTEKYKNVNFHICGFCEDGYEERLKTFSDRKTVIYHGMVNDVREIYKECCAIIHPSYHEGMSNVLLEASACARACLCSDIVGCREIVDDGVTGFLFKAENTQSLISAVEKFLFLDADKRLKMGLCARAKVEKEFDRQIVVDTYINEINKII